MHRLRTPLLALLFLGGLACGNAGEDLGFGLPGNGALQAQVYFDRDWSGTPSGADTTVSGLSVYLLTAGTRDTVATAQTDASGLVSFTGLVPGPYTIAVDSAAALGDSFATTLTPATGTVANGGTAPFISARLGFPFVSAAAARAAVPGRRVVVVATVLAGRQSFSDSSAYVRDTGAAIRLTNAVVTVGGLVAPGDRVRVLGRVSSRAGQPVLDSARIALTVLNFEVPLPDSLTTALAATALGGTLDAGLAAIEGAEVEAVTTQGGDVVLTVNDGSGAVSFRIDQVLQPNPAFFAAGDSVTASGVLVPTGGGAWEIRLRGAQDLSIF